MRDSSNRPTKRCWPLVLTMLLACSTSAGPRRPTTAGGSGGDDDQAGTTGTPDAAPNGGTGGGGGGGGTGGTVQVDASSGDETPDAAPDAMLTVDLAGPTPDVAGTADAGKPGSKLVIDSLDGDVTAHEVDTFLAVVGAMAIPTTQWPNGGHNALADGNGGTTLEAINRLYELTGDLPALATQHAKLLELAIKWSDAWLIHRNDLAQGEKRVMWTGQVDPVWPPDAPPSTYAGCEVGETVGILAYTALNIFKTKAIANDTVPDGDPNSYGKTYLARGKTYLAMLEVSMDKFFNANFLDKATLTIHHPMSAVYDMAPANNVNAWNREMMFLHAWQTLGEIHALLGDDATKATMYKTITVNIVDLFVMNAVPTMAPDGTPVYDWGYGNFGDIKNNKTGEQIGVHAQYDIWGLTRAYRAGYTHATAAQMKRYADTVVHELRLDDGTYAGHIDRCCDTQTYTYLPSGFMYLAPFNPDVYRQGAAADIKSGRQAGSPDLTVGILWAKHQLAHGP